jgi:dihydroorotase
LLTILRGGTVLDPSQGIHKILDVAIDGDRISELGLGLTPQTEAREIDVRGKYVSPGLIDLHGHWYLGSAFGIDPSICLAGGVTTAVDAGTAGFINFADFRRNQIDRSREEVLAFVNIAACGIPTNLMGELEDLRMARPKETLDVLLENRDIALGVKIRVGTMTGANSAKALEYAAEAARSAKLPLMVHIGLGADTAAVLRQLRPGDILTHCFQNRAESIAGAEKLMPEAVLARKEGIIFDVGHGCGSFSWDVARRSFEYDFYPDTISTDLHRYSIGRWAIDMPTTMSKFLHLGMTLDDVILKSTWQPAKAIGRGQQLGTLRIGTVADILVFELEQGEFLFEDTHLKIEKASRRIKPALVIKAGQITNPSEVPKSLRRLYDCDYEHLKLVEEMAP